MFIICTCFLAVVLLWLQLPVFKSAGHSFSNELFLKLQQKYFAVYFPATLADWLQGPYLYKLYSSYGFREDEIFLLYVIGFASSFTFGTCICGLADYFGRQRMCIVFNIVYGISCLSKLSSNYIVLIFGRILGGIGTSILFSVFEAWYIYHHAEKHKFPVSWINNTLSKATFGNGFLAILSGLLSNFLVDVLNMGPVAPFILAVPCLIISGSFVLLLWEETQTLESMQYCHIINIFKVLLRKEIMLLCLIQSVFESVMYIFIILWTPVLSPISPPLGIVFSCFMMCIMIGSSLNKLLVLKKFKSKSILTMAVLLASAAFGVCAVSETLCLEINPYICFLSFLLYEVAVGLYYPVSGYVRSSLIPECYRASLVSWFRLPMNLLTSLGLFYFHYYQSTERNTFFLISYSNHFMSNANIFATCALALLGVGSISANLNIHPHNKDLEQCVHVY